MAHSYTEELEDEDSLELVEDDDELELDDLYLSTIVRGLQKDDCQSQKDSR